MNKTELAAAVAEKAELSKKDAAAAIDAVFEVIGDELQKKEKVQLIGFGTFQTSERKARTGRNPQTGESIKIAAATLPAFKAGKALKEKGSPARVFVLLGDGECNEGIIWESLMFAKHRSLNNLTVIVDHNHL